MATCIGSGMKKATQPSGEDFQKALEALFPKYIESDGCFGHPAMAYMLHGYRGMGGGYMVSYGTFLAKECKNLFSAHDEDAIDCMKYLAHEMYCMVGIHECTKERYVELCRGGEPELFETKT